MAQTNSNPPAVSGPSRLVWQGRMLPAYWTIASTTSMLINVILIVIVLMLLSQIFTLKRLVGDQLVGGLYTNFVKMDQANIRTTIQVNDTIIVKDQIPIQMNIPLKENTSVTLTRDTQIKKTTVFLNGAAVPTDIILPKGTVLDIALDLNVPVDQSIPVELKVPISLTVPVNIPLEQTELHEPFVGLQGVVGPYKSILDKTPGSWSDLCPDWLCR